MPPKKRSRKPPPPDVQRRMDEVLKAIFGAEGPTPVVIDLSESVKPSKKFELSLTENQRKSVIGWCNLPSRLKNKLESTETGKRIVTVTRKELDELHDRIGEASVHAPTAHRKRLQSVQAQVAELFAEDTHEGLVRHNKKQTRTKKPTTNIYQFKITLLDTHPKIWRRIRVQDCFLDRLHHFIQAAMGWTNSHLHHFIIGRERYGIPKWLDDPFLGSTVSDSTKTLLSDVLPSNGKRIKFEYTYDFGDTWDHEVLFEGMVKPAKKTKYPVCVEGQRACPPENCGGVPGYGHLLDVLRDPGQEEYHDALHWVGDDFDPERFDIRLATRRMVKGLRASR